MDSWNHNPKPVVWTATVDSIVENLQRCRQTLESIKSAISDGDEIVESPVMALNELCAPTPKVFIVAEVRLYREGLAGSLSACPRLVVVGTCATRADARGRVRELGPDVALVDVATREGLELISDLRDDPIGCKVLAFAVEDNPADVIACAEAGAAGYVTADASIDDVVAAIERITRSELLCSPRIVAQLFGHISSRGVHPSLESKTLTTRERQVLDGIRQGCSNKEIAQKLNIAEPTVKNHVHHLLEKLDVTTRTQAAACATLSSSRRRALSSRATG